jgi:hypothetical protein
MGTITIISPQKRVGKLTIEWYYRPTKEIFKKIPGLQRAKEIVRKRNTANMKKATYNGIDVLKSIRGL